MSSKSALYKYTVVCTDIYSTYNTNSNLFRRNFPFNVNNENPYQITHFYYKIVLKFVPSNCIQWDNLYKAFFIEVIFIHILQGLKSRDVL